MLWIYKSCDTQIGPKEGNAVSPRAFNYHPVVGSSLGICFEVSMICLYGATDWEPQIRLAEFPCSWQ